MPVELPVVVGVGNFWGFTVPPLDSREPCRHHFTYDLGVIGQALPTGMGVAVAEGRPTLVVQGDGSQLLNVQELESLARHGLPVLVVCVEDGAYGRSSTRCPTPAPTRTLAVFGWVALDEVAAAFGLRSGRSGRSGSVAELEAAVAPFVADPAPTLLDMRVDLRVPSATLGGRLRS